MDDRASHFFTLVGQVCASARLAKLPVRLRLDDGTELEDHPVPSVAHGEELDDTGYEDGIELPDRTVRLSEVVEIAVQRPKTS